MSAVTVVTQQSRDYGAFEYALYSAREELTVFAVLTLIVTGILLFAFLRSRTRVAEKRLEVLKDLARTGQIAERHVLEFLRPARPFVSTVLLVAWMALLGGVAMLLAALAEGWPGRYCDFGVPSVALIGSAIAVISAPIMLREFRKQGLA